MPRDRGRLLHDGGTGGTKSAIDIVDRGQIGSAGIFVSLNDYRPALARQVPAPVDPLAPRVGASLDCAY
jgi:hypothetical protein